MQFKADLKYSEYSRTLSDAFSNNGTDDVTGQRPIFSSVKEINIKGKYQFVTHLLMIEKYTYVSKASFKDTRGIARRMWRGVARVKSRRETYENERV